MLLTITQDIRCNVEEDQDLDREYLKSCLVSINIEKSKDDMYSFYKEYWNNKIKHSTNKEIINAIKMDFNYLDRDTAEKVKNIIKNIKKS